jgi:predicted TIM-barrel fold metal-dependent hydrolase
MAERVHGFGWHVEFMAESLPALLRSMEFLLALKMPYVFDHVAYVLPGMSAANPQFHELLHLLQAEEDAWVNLYSFYQESAQGPPDYADMVPVVQAIIEARPDRVIWGSNWPHAGIHVPMPDDGDLLDFLLAVVPDDKTRKLILADNPADLYGWTAGSD